MTSETASACRFLRRVCIRRTMSKNAGHVHSESYATVAVTVGGAKREDNQTEKIFSMARQSRLQRIPGAHYASCPLLVVAMAPWIIPDLRMKRVFEETRRQEE